MFDNLSSTLCKYPMSTAMTETRRRTYMYYKPYALCKQTWQIVFRNFKQFLLVWFLLVLELVFEFISASSATLVCCIFKSI